MMRMGNSRRNRSGRPRSRFCADDGFEREAPLHRPIQDVRETDCELMNRQPVIVAGPATRREEWLLLSKAVVTKTVTGSGMVKEAATNAAAAMVAAVA